MTRTPVSTNGTFTSVFLLTFYKSSQLRQFCEFQHDFFMTLSWGIVMPIHSVKCTKLITLYAFLTYLLMYRFWPRHFLPVFIMEWCLRSADALGPCNWPVFFWGSKNLIDLETLKKKSSKSDHVYYTFKIFENFMFLEDENVPLVLGGLIWKKKNILIFLDTRSWNGFRQ